MAIPKNPHRIRLNPSRKKIDTKGIGTGAGTGKSVPFAGTNIASELPSVSRGAIGESIEGSSGRKKGLSSLKQWGSRLPPWFRSASIAFLGALLALLLYPRFSPPPKPLTSRQVRQIVETHLKERPPDPTLANRAFQSIYRSLVLIRTKPAAPESPLPVPRQSGPSDKAKADDVSALGTGFIVDEMGTILTCFHVIAPGGKILITFFDGLEAEGEVIFAMPENDLAVLKPSVVPDDAAPAVLAGSGGLRIGDEVVAVGNPFGIASSVSAGVVSGLGRSFYSPRTGQRMMNLIQFDAAVNPGNSGGPLLDRNGEVVGVVSALFNPTEQEVFIGIGFAVPLESAVGAIGIPPW